MMKVYKIIGISVIVIFQSAMSYGQQTAQSENVIRMSEDNITSLVKMLEKYAKKRKEQQAIEVYRYETPKNTIREHSNLELKLLKQEVKHLREQMVSNTSYQDQLAVQRNTYGDEELQYEVRELKRMIQQLMLEQSSKNDIIITTTEEPDSMQEAHIVPITKDNDHMKAQKELDSLRAVLQKEKTQRQLDSLQGVLQNEKLRKEVAFTHDLNGLQKNISELKNEMIVKNVVSEDFEMLKKVYGDYKKQLFFDSNQKVIKKSHNETIDELIAILGSHPSIDVLIKGFASNKGNPIYNENLSLQRTEAVKKVMIIKGVHPTRILTQYHGVDYGATNNILARRVDIELLIRK